MTEQLELFPGDDGSKPLPPRVLAMAEVMLVLAAYGARSDAQLAAYFENGGMTYNRHARERAVEDHLIEKVGETFNDAGNRVMRWDLSQEGKNYLEGHSLWSFKER